jgi:hypothetical protein
MKLSKYMMKPLEKYPFLTWIRPLSPRAIPGITCERIRDKIREFGCCSPDEQKYLDEHKSLTECKQLSN